MQYEDLKQRLSTDHHKLDRLLDALESSLRDLHSGQAPLDDHDFLHDAREDLSFLLEEMFDHFGIEEEAIFQQIRDSLPDMSPDLDQLERDHELLSGHTARLRKMIAAANAGLRELDAPLALQLLAQMRAALSAHNQRELQIFVRALERMNAADRATLLENLEHL
jgi:iron-sulfur cluster repair protein YtfE (RIC family)